VKSTKPKSCFSFAVRGSKRQGINHCGSIENILQNDFSIDVNSIFIRDPSPPKRNFFVGYYFKNQVRIKGITGDFVLHERMQESWCDIFANAQVKLSRTGRKVSQNKSATFLSNSYMDNKMVNFYISLQ
jgi:hypothetical protein